MENSNPWLCNDDNLCNQNGLRQRHRTVLAERKSWKSPSVERSSGRHVSSQGELFAGAFMEDETPLIKKGEEEESLAPSTANVSPVSSIEVGLNCKGKGSTGPYTPWPKTSLGQCGPCSRKEWARYPKEEECSLGCLGGNRPKFGRANSNKSKRVSLNRKVRAAKSKGPAMKKAGCISNQSEMEVDEAEIS
ncbi:hypothetical protein Ancab_029753, partial [Ancistrocladus abbreviatus]